MKIDPNNPVLQKLLNSNAPGGKHAGDARFGDILNKVLERPDLEKATATDLKLIQGISGIQLKAALTAEPTTATRQVEDLLDLLNTYRQMLADPGTTLRDMGPVVDRIEAQRDKLAETMETLDPKNGLRDLINQAMVTATTEVVKFNKGEYIDG
ncbi:MAG: hypothetical protein JEZ11_25390 [Desulfobacterales bacterium]|nr:hypothetical protein [Desulfobacterales bacterium]